MVPDMQSQDAAAIPADVRQRIDAALVAIELEEGVRVLIAVESGSRAWGFASPDSDWDVRFVYVRPIEWYLAIDQRPDVIERPIVDGLDLAGWDLRKALQLLAKPNPALLEWLSSPVIYREDAGVAPALRRLAEATDHRRSAWHHYQHVLAGQYRRSIEGRPEVVLKKYFYCIRPAAALVWLDQRRSGRVPMALPELLAAIDLSEELRTAIAALTERKAAGRDVGTGPRIGVLDRFLEPLMTASMPADGAPLSDQTALLRDLNALFCRIVLSPGESAHNEATARGLV
jgi:predicted nucleotidyltransferase